MPQVYLPLSQRPERSLAIFVRARDTAGVIAAARSEIARLDPDQVLWDARTYEQVMREELNAARVFIALFATFGVAALGLAGLGLYGVVSYGVSQRRQEFGVRIALGARSADVLRLAMGQGVVLTGIGLALGILGRARDGAGDGQRADPRREPERSGHVGHRRRLPHRGGAAGQLRAGTTGHPRRPHAGASGRLSGRRSAGTPPRSGSMG
jgi:hypothetical protein